MTAISVGIFGQRASPTTRDRAAITLVAVHGHPVWTEAYSASPPPAADHAADRNASIVGLVPAPRGRRVLFPEFEQPADEQPGGSNSASKASETAGRLGRDSHRCADPRRQVREPKGREFYPGADGNLHEDQGERDCP